jgi:hypothetical protein
MKYRWQGQLCGPDSVARELVLPSTKNSHKSSWQHKKQSQKQLAQHK